MSWTNEMPKELSVKPLPLIVLTGLDIKHNAIHKEIWDGFNLKTGQKFRYKLLDGDHEYPKSKNKVIYINFNKQIFNKLSLKSIKRDQLNSIYQKEY